MARRKQPADPEVGAVIGQTDLPGMENRAIEELENAARRYAAIRDKRMALNDAEVKLQDLLLGLLKKHGKREYVRDGIRVWIKIEEEKVKVRIEDEDAEGGTDEPVRNDQNARGKNRASKESSGGNAGADHQGQAEGKEVRSETGTLREPGEESF
jgi:hypothetical protein